MIHRALGLRENLQSQWATTLYSFDIENGNRFKTDVFLMSDGSSPYGTICPYRARRHGWSVPRVETRLKPWAEIGVGTKVCFAPPSEPDWQISCIRLSSRWLTFKKIGKPQRALVLRKTSQLRRSRYLAIGVDRCHWPGLFVWFGV